MLLMTLPACIDSKKEEPVNVFQMDQYLNTHYKLKNMYYTTEKWENKKTNKTEYVVTILPEYDDFGEDIDDVLKTREPFLDDDRTITMLKYAKKILNEVPKNHNGIQIDTVVWKKGPEEEMPFLLIQDQDQNT